ncbi:MAG: TIR domain-containing protein [Rhodomicrobium sp.]
MAGETDVFISYSSKDVEHAVALQKVLQGAGLRVWRDKPELEAGEHVGSAIPKALRAAKAVAVIWSEHSAASHWVRWEAGYAAVEGKLACLHIDGYSPGSLNGIFRDYHSEPLAESLADAGKLLRRLNTLKIERESLKRRFIDLQKMPQTFSRELFGREEEMKALFEAWDGGTNIVAFDAIGGTGKTALVKKFIEKLGEEGWRGAEKVFVWSFYSQGTDENRQGDADPFYIAALTFFRYGREAAEAEARKKHGREPLEEEIEAEQLPLIRAKLPTPAEKGRALVRLIRESRTLLFLDGLEPLQYPAGKNSTGGRGDGRTGVSGMLKDKGMASLLRELAADNPGLVLVTTRVPLRDLAEFGPPRVRTISLSQLDETASVKLLMARHVKGGEKHLAKLANDLRGHALALNLVAQYLMVHHGGDARRADLLPDLVHVGGDDERDPYRVMSAYEIEFKKEIARELGIIPKWARKVKLDRLFKTDTLTLSAKALSTAAGRQLALLYMLGLFDQPVPREVFDALIAPPAIPGLTDGMLAAEVRASQWNEAIARLRDQGLISPAYADAPGALDCHPLVREYFGQRLAQTDRTAFKAAHSRLYDHYRYAGLPQAFREPVAYAALAAWVPQAPEHKSNIKSILGIIAQGHAKAEWKAQLPPTLFSGTPEQLRATAELIGGTRWEMALKAFLPGDESGMNPLFSAIVHGCAAEREAETFVEVYIPRIQRGVQNFAARMLGLYGPELSAVATFFETPFTTPSPRLPKHFQALMLNFAGFRLCALGRLEDAAPPIRDAVRAQIKSGNWGFAGMDSGTLCELLITVGRLAGEEGAVAAGEAAVAFADRSRDAFQRLGKRSTHADARFQAGSLAGAEALFRAAEALQKDDRPDLPRLYSLPGYRTCDQLLARDRGREAAIRAAWALKQYRTARLEVLLGVALDMLTQARAALANMPLRLPTPKDCATRSAAALDALRRANDEQYLPRGLLAHAEALWRCGNADAAGEPLSEAEDIAARGPMPLYLTQAHLLRARIALAGQGAADARPYRDQAAALIGKHGYGRGAVELAVLNAEIACAANAPAQEAAIAAALAAIAGEPYRDARTGRTVSGGWFGLLPRLEAILPAGHAGLAQLQAARDAYNAERDDYLRSTLAKDVEGYDPAGDPIAAYLAGR